MLQIPESAQWLPQNTPAILEARGPLMLPEVARELGLNETQVVEALVRVRGERMELYLNGRTIEVPPGWRMSPGQTVWLTAHSTTQGLWVLRQHASRAVAQRALNASAAKAAVSGAAAKPGAASSRPTGGGAALGDQVATKAAVTPEQAAAAKRVERAKVVLQARADGQDPARVLAKQAPLGRAAAQGSATMNNGAQTARMSAMPSASTTPEQFSTPRGAGPARASTPSDAAAQLRPQVAADIKLMSTREALPVIERRVLAGDGPRLPAAASSSTLNTSLAPYWRALTPRPEMGASGMRLPAQSPNGSSSFPPVVPMMTKESSVLGRSLDLLRPEPGRVSSPAVAHAALPAKWAGVWGQPATPDFIDWQQASPRLRELAAHPPGMQAVMQLFQPQVMTVLLQNPALAQWAQLVFRDRMSMRTPDARDVQNAVEHALQPREAQLARGQGSPHSGGHDVRALLGELLRALSAQGDGRAATVRAALSDVEAAQVDHLRALHQREWSFQCVLPFADAPAVQLHLRREPEAEGTDAPGKWAHKWWVSLFTESDDLGQVWMRSGVSSASEVEMQIWATRAHVVSDAQARLDDLRDLLVEAGLQLSQFSITHGPKPQGPVRVPPPHGVVLDRQA